jgi:hypothetical protein
MKLSKIFFALSVCILIVNVNLFAQDKNIKKKDVPSAVLNSFYKMYPKAEIKGTSIETENGKQYYELETVEGSKHRDLLFTKDGNVQENEETVDNSKLPAQVMKTLKNDYKNFEIKKAEKVTSHNKVRYEIQVKNGEKAHELVFDSNGKLVKNEKKQNEKGESGENGEDNDGD